MNAVKVFQNKVNRIKNIDANGNIIFELRELSKDDIEDLQHLRISCISGRIFDDRTEQIN